jgi:hypothetical protein
MNIAQSLWRGNNLIKKLDIDNTKYTVMSGDQSFLNFPIIVEQNSVYKIRIEVKKESGNGILYCNIYGNKNFDFPQMKICCENKTWDYYEFHIETKHFPKTLPLFFRLWRGSHCSGSIGIRNITVSLKDDFIEIKELQNNISDESNSIVNKIHEIIENNISDESNNIVNKTHEIIENNSKCMFEKHILKYNEEKGGIKVFVVHYSPEDTTLVNQIGLLEAFCECGFHTIGFNFCTCFYDLGFKDFQDALISAIRHYKPEWIHFQTNFEKRIFDPNTLLKIANEFNESYISNWTPDIRGDVNDFYVNFGKEINKPMLCSEGQLQLYRDAGCSRIDYWQSGYDQKYFYRKSEEERKELREKYNHDVVFCAHNIALHNLPGKKWRSDVAEFIYNEYKDNFYLYGFGWDFLNKNFNKRLNFYEQNDVYNGSKIVLSINCVNDVKKYFSDRQLISMASGSLALSKYIPGIEEYFENHKHLVWFNTKEECLDLINYYLKHDDEREQIGINGARELLKQHTYFERVSELSYRCGFKK